MALKWLTAGLEYSASLSEASCFTHSCGFLQVCLRIDVSRSANRAPNIHDNMWREELGVKCSAAVVASSLAKSCSPHLEHGIPDDPAHSKPSFSSTNHIRPRVRAPKSSRHSVQSYQESTQAFVNPAMWLLQVFAAQLYLCQLDHHWSKVEMERGVSHIWVLSNTMAHCDQKATENNPYSESIVPIQLVWLWDNAMIPYCHLID